jgi:hypothetical protein
MAGTFHGGGRLHDRKTGRGTGLHPKTEGRETVTPRYFTLISTTPCLGTLAV